MRCSHRVRAHADGTLFCLRMKVASPVSSTPVSSIAGWPDPSLRIDPSLASFAPYRRSRRTLGRTLVHLPCIFSYAFVRLLAVRPTLERGPFGKCAPLSSQSRRRVPRSRPALGAPARATRLARLTNISSQTDVLAMTLSRRSARWEHCFLEYREEPLQFPRRSSGSRATNDPRSSEAHRTQPWVPTRPAAPPHPIAPAARFDTSSGRRGQLDMRST
jgi:hypothetical protein